MAAVLDGLDPCGPALDIRRRLAEGSLGSAELVSALQARTDAVDPSIRGYAWQLRDAALDSARACDAQRDVCGGIHGVPVVVSEDLAVQGVPLTFGLPHRLDEVCRTDGPVVERLRRAGAVLLGKGNVPRLLSGHETHNDIWGTTRNPWQLGRVTGGSGGGVAALVASGQAPWGLGTDLDGALRLACAWCGLAGLRPTSARLPSWHPWTRWLGWSAPRVTPGVLARSSQDVAALWTGLAGASPPSAPAAVRHPRMAGLRVGLDTRAWAGDASSAASRVVQEAALLLTGAGAEVVELPLPSAEPLSRDHLRTQRADWTRLQELLGDPTATQPFVAFRGGRRWARGTRWALGRRGDSLGRSLAQSCAEARRAELAAWDRAGIDLLLGAPCRAPAPLRQRTGGGALLGERAARWSLLDLPAGVVPSSTLRAGESEEGESSVGPPSVGLPLGVQLVGRPMAEELILAAMVALEEAARATPSFPVAPAGPWTGTA